jgi:hypothetical protein
LLGARQAPQPGTADATTVAELHETLNHQQGFNRNVSALASRTELAPEDVMAEAVRFAERHQEAFHDFIYKGDAIKPAGERTGSGSVNTIVAMTFLLGVLMSLIVILGTR